MSDKEDEIFAHLLAGEIHEEVQSQPMLKGIVEAINSNLGESPEAIRGALIAFSVVSMVVVIGEDRHDNPSQHLIKLMAAWQAQPHVMALLDAIVNNTYK